MAETAMALGAEAVIDEIDVLEAALHKATARQPVNMAPQRRLFGGGALMEPLSARSTPSYVSIPPKADGLEAAEMVYGLQLKAWIDMQVDTRINMIQSAIEGKLATVEQDTAAVLEEATSLNMELEVVKGSQARLVSVAQDMSDELSRVKAEVQKEVDVVDRLAQLVEELRATMLSKEQGQMLLEYVTSHESSLTEVQKGLADCQTRQGEIAIVVNDLKTVQCEASPTASADVSQLTRQLEQLEQNQSTWHADLRAEVSEELTVLKTAMRQNKSMLADASSFKDARVELDLAEKRRQRQLEELRKQLDGEFEALQIDIKELRDSSAELNAITFDENRSIKEQLKEIRDSSQELNYTAKKQLTDLHSEMQEAFKGEAEAVASLDRNLWRTARQLGTRIDELVENHNECLVSMTERCNFGMGRLVCSPPAASISNTVMSPRTEIHRTSQSSPCDTGMGKLVCSAPAASISNTVMSPQTEIHRRTSQSSQSSAMERSSVVLSSSTRAELLRQSI